MNKIFFLFPVIIWSPLEQDVLPGVILFSPYLGIVFSLFYCREIAEKRNAQITLNKQSLNILSYKTTHRDEPQKIMVHKVVLVDSYTSFCSQESLNISSTLGYFFLCY